MLRSTLPLLARAARPAAAPSVNSRGAASRASLCVRASSSTAGPSAQSSSDYDQIMRPSASSFSSVAGKTYDNYSVSYGRSPMSTGASQSSAAGPAAAGERAFGNLNCYRTVDEPTGFEDYDELELHHAPFARTRDSYCGASYYSPTIDGGEKGSII